jgi:hypothetical protein
MHRIPVGKLSGAAHAALKNRYCALRRRARPSFQRLLDEIYTTHCIFTNAMKLRGKYM